MYKIYHISAATEPRILNLVPDLSLDTDLFSPGQISNYLICIVLNIMENSKREDTS